MVDLKKIFQKIVNLDIYIAIFLLLLPSLIYLHTTNIQDYVDYLIPSAKGLTNLLYTWQQINFGVNNVGSLWRIFPLSAYYFLLNYIGHISPSITQQVFLSILRIVGFFSFLKLLREVWYPTKIHRTSAILACLFFVYNLYTVTVYSGAFIVLLPYYILPLQLLLFIKAVRTNRISFLLILSLVNFAVFGVNLVYDVIAITTFLIYSFASVFIIKESTFKNIIRILFSVILITIFLSIWWILPLFYGNLTDTATASFVLHSENFYNLQTTILNLFQGLGDWGFFSGYKGVLYHNFSSLYLSNFLIILASFVPITLMLYGLIIRRDKKNISRNLLLFFYCLILLLMLFIGGSNSTIPTSQLLSWAFIHVPYFNVLRNTYKWMSLMMLIQGIILAYVLNFIFLGKKNFFNIILTPIFLTAIIVSTAPIWVGTIYEGSTILSSVPSYWIDAENYINSNLNPGVDRIFLLPNQYFSIFKWNGNNIIFPTSLEDHLFNTPVIENICNGCGQYYTSGLLEFLYKNIDSVNFSKILGLLNVSYILQRDDYDFSYYNVESPLQIKAILNKQIVFSPIKFGMLDLYKINSAFVYPRVYSPQYIVATNSLDDTLNIFSNYDFGNKNIAFVLLNQGNLVNSVEKSNLITDYFSGIFNENIDNVSEGNSITDTITTIPSNSYRIHTGSTNKNSNYKISYRSSNTGYVLQFKNIDEQITFNGQLLINKSSSNLIDEVTLNVNSSKSIAININGSIYILNPSILWIDLANTTLPANQNIQINIYSISVKSNLLNNPSFEKGTWGAEVSNCSETSPNADISFRIDKQDSTDGKNSLLLDAKADSACIHSEPINSFKPNEPYLIEYDYKIIKGASPSLCAWDGNDCALYETSKETIGWNTERTAVLMPKNAKQFLLYLYASRGNYDETEILYDNVRIYDLGKPIATQLITLSNEKVNTSFINVSSTTSKITANVFVDDSNIINNSSFEDGLWHMKASSCGGLSKDSQYSQIKSSDSTNGSSSLQLSSFDAIACESSAIVGDPKNNTEYLLSFDYKILSGETAGYCVWDGISCLKQDSLTAPNSNWQHYQIWLNAGTSTFSIYLYAPSNADKSIVRYDNVSVKKVLNNIANTYDVQMQSRDELPSIGLTYTRVNPIKYILSLEPFSSGAVVLQESYHSLWKAQIIAKIDGKDVSWQIPEDNHFIANGFANGWILNINQMPSKFKSATNLEMVIEFTPQRWFYLGLIISGLTLVACIEALIIIGLRRWRVLSGKRSVKILVKKVKP